MFQRSTYGIVVPEVNRGAMLATKHRIIVSSGHINRRSGSLLKETNKSNESMSIGPSILSDNQSKAIILTHAVCVKKGLIRKVQVSTPS